MPHYGHGPRVAQRPGSAPAQLPPTTPTPKFWEKPVAEFPHAVGPVLCSLKFTPSPVVVPSSSLASERGGRAAAGVAGNPDGAKKLQGRGPLPGASHCLCSPDLWSRWLLGVRMKSTPTAPARIDKRFQSRHPQGLFPHSTAQLPRQKKWELSAQGGTWEPVRLQEVRLLEGGEVPSQEEKRKHCISFSFSLGEKENFRSPGSSISLGKHKEPGLS